MQRNIRDGGRISADRTGRSRRRFVRRRRRRRHRRPPPQFPNMTFFVTSVGGPQGANYGGLEGADRHCQTLAAKAGAGGKTWRAYLSTQAVGGATAVNAKDRIGKGPWVNAKGVTDRHQRRRPALGQQQDRAPRPSSPRPAA